MDVIWILIPLSIVLILIAVRAFVWAVKSRQFDDLDREASRILFDEPNPESAQKRGQHEERREHD
ncbi:MAG: cbb3-type cytochrome oxidase assembly protein CcoS [Gammaproteobacteria bacterium]|nr:MAG: cbb3-type cytochrome oxidase assembly protein CcoS [Gammaproteobacteria bacterium]